jgi:hypothetical protein
MENEYNEKEELHRPLHHQIEKRLPMPESRKRNLKD